MKIAFGGHENIMYFHSRTLSILGLIAYRKSKVPFVSCYITKIHKNALKMSFLRTSNFMKYHIYNYRVAPIYM